jgi:hypothetical protein
METGTFFTMQKNDAVRSLNIYKTMREQCEKSSKFFSAARRLQHVLGVEIPEFKTVTVLNTIDQDSRPLLWQNLWTNT